MSVVIILARMDVHGHSATVMLVWRCSAHEAHPIHGVTICLKPHTNSDLGSNQDNTASKPGHMSGAEHCSSSDSQSHWAEPRQAGSPNPRQSLSEWLNVTQAPRHRAPPPEFWLDFEVMPPAWHTLPAWRGH